MVPSFSMVVVKKQKLSKPVFSKIKKKELRKRLTRKENDHEEVNSSRFMRLQALLFTCESVWRNVFISKHNAVSSVTLFNQSALKCYGGSLFLPPPRCPHGV